MLAGDVPILPEDDERATTRIALEDIPPTMLAPEPEPERSGVRTGALRFGVILLAIGVLLAGIGIAAGVQLTHAGIIVDKPIGRTAAAAGLAVLIGAAAICGALAVLALWATRNRSRAHARFVRNLIGVLAVLIAGLTSGTIVWTANAWITVGVSALWGKLQ